MSKSLNYIQADEFLRAFEAEADLLRHEVDGWCVWPLLRTAANAMLQAAPVERMPRLDRWERLSLSFMGLPRLIFLPRRRWLITSFSSARMEEIDGRFVDIFFDELLVGAKDWFKIEMVNSPAFRGHARACLVKSDMYLDPITLAVSVLERCRRQPEIEQTAAELSAALCREPRFASFTPQYVSRVLMGFHWGRKVWSWVLRRIGPEQVMRADNADHAVTAAAKGLGIGVIEFQHGVADRFHPAYSWSTYALKYKSKMPIPDRVFTFGAYWQRQLMVGQFWGDALRPVGSLRMDYYRKLREQVQQRDGVPTILVTTQGVERERLIAFFSEFLRYCHGKLALRVCFKLHPVYDTDKTPYAEAFSRFDNVVVRLGSEQPSTFELLTTARWHASVSSMCHYDALGLGVPTIILPFSTHEAVAHLHEEGFAWMAHSPRELTELLLDPRSHECRQACSTYFYARDARNNIKRELGI